MTVIAVERRAFAAVVTCLAAVMTAVGVKPAAMRFGRRWRDEPAKGHQNGEHDGPGGVIPGKVNGIVSAARYRNHVLSFLVFSSSVMRREVFDPGPSCRMR